MATILSLIVFFACCCHVSTLLQCHCVSQHRCHNNAVIVSRDTEDYEIYFFLRLIVLNLSGWLYALQIVLKLARPFE